MVAYFKKGLKMGKSNYRIKKYDPVNDIWILQEKKLLFFWFDLSVGSKEKLKKIINDLERTEDA